MVANIFTEPRRHCLKVTPPALSANQPYRWILARGSGYSNIILHISCMIHRSSERTSCADFACTNSAYSTKVEVQTPNPDLKLTGKNQNAHGRFVFNMRSLPLLAQVHHVQMFLWYVLAVAQEHLRYGSINLRNTSVPSTISWLQICGPLNAQSVAAKPQHY